MDGLCGNKIGKYTHFSLIILDTCLVKKVQKGKEERRVVTECNQDFTTTSFWQESRVQTVCSDIAIAWVHRLFFVTTVCDCEACLHK